MKKWNQRGEYMRKKNFFEINLVTYFKILSLNLFIYLLLRTIKANMTGRDRGCQINPL
jgi:hypothetical protein